MVAIKHLFVLLICGSVFVVYSHKTPISIMNAAAPEHESASAFQKIIDTLPKCGRIYHSDCGFSTGNNAHTHAHTRAIV